MSLKPHHMSVTGLDHTDCKSIITLVNTILLYKQAKKKFSRCGINLSPVRVQRWRSRDPLELLQVFLCLYLCPGTSWRAPQPSLVSSTVLTCLD